MAIYDPVPTGAAERWAMTLADQGQFYGSQGQEYAMAGLGRKLSRRQAIIDSLLRLREHALQKKAMRPKKGGWGGLIGSLGGGTTGAIVGGVAGGPLGALMGGGLGAAGGGAVGSGVDIAMGRTPSGGPAMQAGFGVAEYVNPYYDPYWGGATGYRPRGPHGG